MKKHIKTLSTGLYLCLISFTPAHSKTSVNLNSDAYVRFYTVDKISSGSKVTKSAQAQQLRIGMDITHLEEDHSVSIKSRLTLSGDHWDGDRPLNNTGISGSNDDGGGGNTARLDYGYLEYVDLSKQFTFRAGRQMANWANCLTTCDDRRDRLMFMRRSGQNFFIGVFDKRYSGEYQNSRDDGDMYAILTMRFTQNYELGLLAAYWQNSDSSYVLEDVFNFSPYIKYRYRNLQFNLLVNWLGQGSDNSWFPKSHTTAVFGVEASINEMMKLETQTLQVFNGGYLSTGYDTYLPHINSNPEHNQSLIQAIRVGGLGTFTGGRKHRDSLYSTRLTYKIDNNWSISPSYGYLQQESSQKTEQLKTHHIALKANYQINNFSQFSLSGARSFGDKHLTVGLAEFSINLPNLALTK